MRPPKIRAIVLALAALAPPLSACDRSPSMTQPSDGLNLAGMWTGSASDSSGPGDMSWQLTQTGASFSGTLTMTDAASGSHGRGSVSGTVSGPAVRFTMTVPAGGFDDPWTACSADVSGNAQATSSSITAAYSGSNSCTGTIASGQLTLNRQ
ncbi:MAG TPA: hypothetical protein VM818_07715 [Vicinamibacterales bacterium]|jgi:hypothetical protein|nr:hypothetical protein [Vicinamibacterales bacterium]